MRKCSGPQSVTYVPRLVHKMTLGYIQMKLLNFNSHVFVSPCIRKCAVSIESPRFHGLYCLGGDQEMVPTRTAALLQQCVTWLMEQNPPWRWVG